jgi:hypothetical protein
MNAILIPAPAARVIAQQVTEAGTRPLREARIYRVLTEAGYSAAEVAEMAGKTTLKVTIRLSLLELGDAGRAALENGTIPVGLAWYIARLSAANQRLVLTRWTRGDYADAHAASDAAVAIYSDEQFIA